MSAFNTVTIFWKEKTSQQNYPIKIQFKYGEVWQHEYQIGDLLQWGNNEVGDPSAKKVVVEGILEGEKLTEDMPEEFEIYIKDNIIQSVSPHTEKYNFLTTEDDYIIIE